MKIQSRKKKIDFVCAQTGCDRERARRILELHAWIVADALDYLNHN